MIINTYLEDGASRSPFIYIVHVYFLSMLFISVPSCYILLESVLFCSIPCVLFFKLFCYVLFYNTNYPYPVISCPSQSSVHSCSFIFFSVLFFSAQQPNYTMFCSILYSILICSVQLCSIKCCSV